MIDAKRLLEQFLSGGRDAGQPGGTQPGAGQAGQSPGPALGGLPGRLGDVLGSVQDHAKRNPLISGALAGGLASLILGSRGGRKLAGNILTYGGIAAIGGLAYKAYRDYQAAKQAPASQPAGQQAPVALLPPPADSPFAIENAPQGAEVFALELVAAMINAAKADGHIDQAERATIEARLTEGGLDEEERRFLAQELAGPLDIERVVKAAKTKEEAIELYTASSLAITADHPAERGYLDMLAARLGLEPELAKSVERAVAASQA